MPSRDPPQEPPRPFPKDMSVKNDSIPLGNRDDAGKLRRWSEKSSGAYQVRPKVSMARSKEQIDLSKMIRKDPAWKRPAARQTRWSKWPQLPHGV
eukprot:g20146.t1